MPDEFNQSNGDPPIGEAAPVETPAGGGYIVSPGDIYLFQAGTVSTETGFVSVPQGRSAQPPAVIAALLRAGLLQPSNVG